MHNSALFLLLLLLVTTMQTSCTPTSSRDPGTDHFDGSRFHTPGRPRLKSSWDLLRWQLTRKPGPWPAFSPLPATDTPPPRVAGDELRVSSKKRDSLQEVIALLKDADVDCALQFTNYR